LDDEVVVTREPLELFKRSNEPTARLWCWRISASLSASPPAICSLEASGPDPAAFRIEQVDEIHGLDLVQQVLGGAGLVDPVLSQKLHSGSLEFADRGELAQHDGHDRHGNDQDDAMSDKQPAGAKSNVPSQHGDGRNGVEETPTGAPSASFVGVSPTSAVIPRVL
jgi:hypothetical protein